MQQAKEDSRRRLLLAGLALIVAIIGLFSLVELVLWAAGVESIAQRQRALSEPQDSSERTAITQSPTFGWAPRPGARETIGGVMYSINSLGFRGEELPQQKPERSLRILCLGDSCTYGLMVSADDAYPAVLERLLADRLAPRQVEVINGGVLGYSSLQALILLQEKGFALQPDIVTVGVGFNDSGSIPGAIIVDGTNYFIDKTDVELYGFWRRLATKCKIRLGASRTFSLLDRAITSLVGSSHQLLNRAQTAAPARRKRVPIPEYEANLASLAKQCQQRGIGVVMVSLSIPEDYASAVRRAAEAQSTAYVDTEPIFAARSVFAAAVEERKGAEARTGSDSSSPGEQADQDNVWAVQAQKGVFIKDADRKFSQEMLLVHSDTTLFFDRAHPTPLGHRIVAQLIADAIFERGLVK